MTIGVETLSGDDLAQGLDAVARLRMAVFRSYPYLYDGSLDYERVYLEKFATAEGAIIAVARDGDEVVGAATGCPLVAEHEAFSQPLRSLGHDVNDIFYCAESVLLPQYRGQGLGHRFFDLREAQARRLGARKVAFCAVARPAGHPLRPADYIPLDGFWRRRGYAPVDGAVARFAWKDIDQPAETEKPLQFWMRQL